MHSAKRGKLKIPPVASPPVTRPLSPVGKRCLSYFFSVLSKCHCCCSTCFISFMRSCSSLARRSTSLRSTSPISDSPKDSVFLGTGSSLYKAVRSAGRVFISIDACGWNWMPGCRRRFSDDDIQGTPLHKRAPALGYEPRNGLRSRNRRAIYRIEQ